MIILSGLQQQQQGQQQPLNELLLLISKIQITEGCAWRWRVRGSWGQRVMSVSQSLREMLLLKAKGDSERLG